MRKIQFYLLVICLFVVMTGCVNNDYEEREKTPDSQQAVEERNEDFNNVKGNVVIDNELSDSGEENIAFPNPYFYNLNYTILKAEYYEHWGNLSNETVDMQISFVKSYEQGNVYKFTIDLLPDLFPSYFSGENMNIYFYVTEDKIYRLRPYVQLQPNGETYYFYDDDELLTQMLDTDEKVMNNGEIVCQEEETDEEYSSIKVNGNQITYSRHETKPNGEDGYKEIFVWEKGKGLLEYRVGFGSQPYAVYLGEILEVESAESRQSESEAMQSPDETVEQDYMTESYDAGEGVFMSEYMKEMDAEFQETVIEAIRNCVYTIRGQQVMLDYDLAAIYGYKVKRLNEQVKRNISRFPEDFMFQLDSGEIPDSLKSQFATLNAKNSKRGMHIKKMPYCMLF